MLFLIVIGMMTTATFNIDCDYSANIIQLSFYALWGILGLALLCVSPLLLFVYPICKGYDFLRDRKSRKDKYIQRYNELRNTPNEKIQADLEAFYNYQSLDPNGIDTIVYTNILNERNYKKLEDLPREPELLDAELSVYSDEQLRGIYERSRDQVQSRPEFIDYLVKRHILEKAIDAD
jgi:hypothetical protein